MELMWESENNIFNKMVDHTWTSWNEDIIAITVPVSTTSLQESTGNKLCANQGNTSISQ